MMYLDNGWNKLIMSLLSFKYCKDILYKLDGDVKTCWQQFSTQVSNLMAEKCPFMFFLRYNNLSDVKTHSCLVKEFS